MMAVGTVGEALAGYTCVSRFVRFMLATFLPSTLRVSFFTSDSDTFLTRDAGFTWEEVHKDAHLWEFGDYGSILILAK